MTTSSPRPCGCSEYQSLSRRTLLGSLAIGSGAVLLGSSARADAVTTSMSTVPLSDAAATGSVLVLLSLRGAADGLSLVVPHGDPVYYRARPRLAVPSTALLHPDPMFGLHPAMAPLTSLWESGRLAAVHACGMPVANRSHFAAMEAIEDAAPGSRTRNGWLNRLLGELPGASVLQGIALGAQVPTSMFGEHPAFAVTEIAQATVSGNEDGRRTAALRHAWPRTSPMGRAVRDTLGGVDAFAPARNLPERPAPIAFPRSELGRAMADVSRIIRAGVGAQVFTVDQGDWDLHTDHGNLEWGGFRNNADDLARSVAAFFADLGPAADRVTLVTLSEFGRRVVENDDYGTDHGHGNVMLVAGAGVRGGRYLGSWPGLHQGQDADLAVTTDYRSVLSELVTRRFGVSTAQVFPGFSPSRVGVMLGA